MIEFFTAFTIGFVLSTLVEYVTHRLMHKGKVVAQTHREHHKENSSQGWLGEFKDYLLPSLIGMGMGFFYSLSFGIGWFLSGLVYTALAAYAHQIQHENPRLVFWMRQPIHYTHHEHQMWKHNFGILVDWWDRIFGTYKKVELNWGSHKPVRGLLSYFSIRWV